MLKSGRRYKRRRPAGNLPDRLPEPQYLERARGKVVRMNLTLDEQTARSLRMASRSLGRNMSDIADEAIMAWLRERWLVST